VNFLGSVFTAFFLWPFTLPPLFLSICNIVFLATLKFGKEKGVFRAIVDVAIMVLGLFFTYLVLVVFYDDYVVGPLPANSFWWGYTPIAFEHALTIRVLTFVALTGFFILRFFRKWLPPIPMCLCLSAIFIGVVLSVVYSIQLMRVPFPQDFQSFFLFLYPLNFILCCIRLVWRCVSEELGRLDPSDRQGKIVARCKRLLTAGKTWLIIFALSFPLLAVLVLLGQSPDAAIRAFTQTSDWTLSAYDWPCPEVLPPPPREPHEGGHYLCTVALRVSAAVVKLLRFGVRHGKRIVVNRQLCVANAFEQRIMEKAPRFHGAVRGLYDRCGYPLSKHITTKKRANAVYILMKPFEWAFVLFLYTADKRPENRIASQYLGLSEKI